MTEDDTPKALNVWPGVMATAVAALAMLAASAWVWDRIPERLPVHFGLDGAPDRYGSKWEAMLVMPAITVLIGALMAVIPMIDPRRNNLAQSSGFYYAAWYGVLAVMAVSHAGFIGAATGWMTNIGQALFVAIGGLFVVLGNYMGKSRANWFAGFRTPWTLSSDYSWQKTHRATGWMFIATGVATIVAGLTANMLMSLAVMMGGTLVTAVVGTVLSYVYWRNDPERRGA